MPNKGRSSASVFDDADCSAALLPLWRLPAAYGGRGRCGTESPAGSDATMHTTYRWIARRRSCANGVCEIDGRRSLGPRDCLPLLIVPIVALLAASWMPRWGFMWAMASALYAGCKWLTYREARVR